MQVTSDQRSKESTARDMEERELVMVRGSTAGSLIYQYQNGSGGRI